MKTVIIPDIHTNYTLAEIIIDKEKPDKVVFLGDYFDQFDDTPEIAYQVAQWLKESLTKPNRTHLIGNHDISYMTNGEQACSGWDGAKQFFINKVGINWKLLQHYCWVGDWLCTHAGLSYEFYEAYAGSGDSVNNFLETYSQDTESRKRLYDVSPYRGGRNAFGGILWCDYEEFIDIPDTKQIFGHTHGDVRHGKFEDGGEHYCIDTWLEYYAVHENDKMEIKKV